MSCLQFRKYYDKVELVTDKKGKEIFIDQLKLPYTKVEVVLDDLNDYHPQLWALGKIYCYEMQNEPFIHADGDVFVWERFDKTFEEAPLVAQHLEVGFNYYYRLLNQVKEHFEYISSCLQKDWAENEIVYAYNSGIIGGTDVDLFKEYAQESLTFLHRNQHLLSKVNVEDFAVFDQYFFYCFTREHQKQVLCYADNVKITFEGFDDFLGIPGKNKFLHILNISKKKIQNCELLAFRLRKDYPEYYYRILHLLKTFEI